MNTGAYGEPSTQGRQRGTDLREVGNSGYGSGADMSGHHGIKYFKQLGKALVQSQWKANIENDSPHIVVQGKIPELFVLV